MSMIPIVQEFRSKGWQIVVNAHDQAVFICPDIPPRKKGERITGAGMFALNAVTEKERSYIKHYG